MWKILTQFELTFSHLSAPETSGTPYYVIFLEVRLTPSTDAATLQKGIVDKVTVIMVVWVRYFIMYLSEFAAGFETD